MERDWNTWDDSPRTVEEHIEQYREKLGKPSPPPEPVQEPDFFQDMTPQLIEQPKIFVPSGNSAEEERRFNRLQADTVDIAVTSELKDWEELEQQQGWDEVDDESTKHLIREKRREMRQQRHQQRQQQRQ